MPIGSFKFDKFATISSWASLMIASLESRHGVLPTALKTELTARMQPGKYLYNTFQPTKTVCDFLIVVTISGNTESKPINKTGVVLRWDMDGTVTNQNGLPAYTLGTNAGIVTASTTDSFNGLTYLQFNATNISRFYAPVMNAITYFSLASNTLLNSPVIAGLSALTRLELQGTGISSIARLLSSPLLNTLLLQDNKLNQFYIDGILSDLVANNATGGSYCQMNGVENATPSSSGASNKAILLGRGWNMVTN